MEHFLKSVDFSFSTKITKMNAAQAIWCLGSLAATFMGAILIPKYIEHLPETETSFKHKMNHKMGDWGNVKYFGSRCDRLRSDGVMDDTHCIRCATCAKISPTDEKRGCLQSGEPEDDKESRVLHKKWFARTGPKDHALYLQWLPGQRIRVGVKQ
jgi:ferredoxin